MSSAAVQHSTPSQYDGTPGRERYHGNPAATLSSSPPSSRRSGRAGGNGSAYPPHTPQHTSLDSPGTPTSMSTPRAAGPSSVSDGQASAFPPYYPDQGSTSLPSTVLPVRTSSQQHSQASAATAAAPGGYDGSGSRYGSRAQASASGYGSESDRVATSDSERRRQHRSPREENAPGSGRSQRSRHAPTASRSATAVGQPPIDTSLPRENSAVIKHIVVDDPRTDLERERARTYEARPQAAADGTSMARDSGGSGSERPSTQPQQRSRQEHLRSSTHRKEMKFGEYILGQTLGEGEFGKVKMGWKKDSSMQVAIKLIRKESLAGNSTRLPKIYREIAILKELDHPNIVKLHEFVETERHMGIILEYASGGELFDYILNQRYLADEKARKLFAQLISGVGYLHKKGIVHRDLKLENLLLDRNKNIIITDFGFANTFNPNDELGEDVERRITDKEFVKREGLDIIGPDNHRRGDLMQTSCGSPCYAAPELVVSDGLYTGRKVDVWSCGVILYAMLAGYLPFDDDPANPEGDNINLLYKYIVSTPLTFPEYVTPHARDLLRRILVPDPRRRADLFEVARHSWLSDYMHVVGFIGSSTKSDRDIARSALRQDDEPLLGRSASVREPATRSPMATQKQQPASSGDEASDARNKHRDAKRRTVQVEYVAPPSGTTRADVATAAAAPSVPTGGRTRARGDGYGPVEVTPQQVVPRKEVSSSQAMAPPARPVRDQSRIVSDSSAFSAQPTTSSSRPTTGGTLGGGARLPSRGNSYSQPAIATPTTENVQGRFSQPKSSAGYIISSPITSDLGAEAVRPGSQQNLAHYQQNQTQPLPPPHKSHKRSSTLSSIGDRLLGRSNSRRSSKGQEAAPAIQNEKRDRRYPPLSMKNAMPATNEDATPRPSTESKRRPSFSSFMRKNSDALPSVSGGGEQQRRTSRRFSLLPASFSMHSFIGAKKDSEGYDSENPRNARRDSLPRGGGRPPSKGMAFGRGQSRSPSQSTTNSTIPLYYEAEREAAREQRRSGMPQGQAPPSGRYDKALPPEPAQQATPPMIQRKQYRDDGYGDNVLDSHQPLQDPVERYYTPPSSGAIDSRPRALPDQYHAGSRIASQGQHHGANDYAAPIVDDGYGANPTAPVSGGSGNAGNVLRPQQRKFGDAYEQGHAGSSSGARRVMEFFRRRGKDRSQL